jgi:hypothetical protein
MPQTQGVERYDRGRRHPPTVGPNRRGEQGRNIGSASTLSLARAWLVVIIAACDGPRAGPAPFIGISRPATSRSNRQRSAASRVRRRSPLGRWPSHGSSPAASQHQARDR